MGSTVTETLGELVAALSGKGKPKDGPMTRASVVRQAVGTLEQFPEDQDAAAAYSEGARSHAGLSASSLEALLLLRAVYAAMDQMAADTNAGICSPSADVVDLIVGADAIKDGRYKAAKWALYDLVVNGKREGVVPAPSGAAPANYARPVRIVYFPVVEGSLIADVLTRLIARADEALPKSLSEIEVPEFHIRFVGCNTSAD